jgi:hypothetical protein
MAVPWLDPAVSDWPTRAYASARLRYALSAPEDWADPELHELPTHLEELFRSDDEGLLVQFMDAADPAADLATWATAPVTLAGAPAVALAVAPGSETIDWRAVVADGLTDRLAVDEALLFAGTTRSPDDTVGRVYVVLARRGTSAWNVGLSLEGVDDERAAATLGTLSFS